MSDSGGTHAAARRSGRLGVLDADEDVLVVGRDHYLVLLGADAQEAEVVGRVHVAHHRARFGGQVVDQPGVLNGRAVVQRGANRDACGQEQNRQAVKSPSCTNRLSIWCVIVVAHHLN